MALARLSSVMRPGIAFLLVVGLLLGPIYYGYCLLFSGQVTRTVPMTERAARWVTPEGSILRFANGMAYKPVALSLTPDMNRVVLRLRFAFATNQTTSAGEQRYQATLSQLDHTVLERPFVVRAKGGGSETIDIGPMEITYPAEYLFIVEEAGTVTNVPQLTTEIIENVDTPLRPVIWSGMALLIMAVVLSLRDVMRGTRAPPAA